ncbi:MAG: type III-B CRISPR module RAMP protein Cmr1 [Syntrophomonas sp.]|uniref:type III-B CRISPR module RAMP protein Cmr1 n=1 Tax=Syntrophomonas sp. TaxID=2053627 RepID=UPI00262F5D04|nr:type III-B CRISPR module RAMP protein Cmr1 [Syntrophomonas sp.]MDD2510964.1 type III-B CRISPR module RAMP protein Cmr1 [Syntrophomonas sp.]MDD3879182.1 type III-B CRISPR module RAMP protein Cmr1 [Syntrophomonas sp.]MDD4626008.1 type III-B CRISPR module RAMP protein Cmr1 [Syntrophomonas sp.]
MEVDEKSDGKRITVTFECETITPMFLRGADGRTPELRAPSIKGAIRYWWRSLQDSTQTKSLLEREINLFGGTGSSGKKSPVSIRVISKLNDSSIGHNLWDELDKETPSGKTYYRSKSGSRGIHYLFYSVLPMNTRLDGPYIKSGSEFSVILSAYEQEPLQEASIAFMFLSIFGGLGSRVRRGAGSFDIIKVESTNITSELDNILIACLISKRLKNHEGVCGFLRDIIESNIVDTCTNLNTVNSFKEVSLYVFRPQKSWKEAMDKIGVYYMNFRNRNKGRIEETPNFGFPIRHKNGTTMMAGMDMGEKQKPSLLRRRASPIVIKVIRDNNGNYYPMMIWFKSRLLPGEYQIMDEDGGNKMIETPGIIQEFINSIPVKEYEEVRL